MSSDAESGLPNLVQILARILQGVPREQQPLLIALAERMAAERYRTWADDAEGTRRAELLACADREQEIAGRVEGLYPDGAAIQREMFGANADLAAANRTLFAGRPLAQQFALQAQGERMGAATWRSFAKHATSAERRETFLACAALEEESAAVLESYRETAL
jgi:hypothetical protein